MIMILSAKTIVYLTFAMAYGWYASCYVKQRTVPVSCYVAIAAGYAALALCIVFELAMAAFV